MKDRDITLPDTIYVLKKGRFEKQKTCFDERSKKWRYAIRGKTRDNVEIRVVITFDDKGMIIITVIDLVKKDAI
jgi:hypothetical protein